MAKSNFLIVFVFSLLIVSVISFGAYLVIVVLESDSGISTISTYVPTGNVAEQQNENIQHTPIVQTSPSTQSAQTTFQSLTSFEEDNNEDNEQDDETDEDEQTQETTQSATTNTCLTNYNIGEHTIIFYHLNEPHSNAMKPIVQELETIYNFYWQNDVWDGDFNSCFGHSTGAIPAFVCAGTKEKIVGQVSKAQLIDFAGNC